MTQENTHTICVLVENEFGVLARIASLFSGKGYNIDSLSVSPTQDDTVSRMTIVTHGSDAIIEQIVKQLNKLINVLEVQDVTGEYAIDREMILLKVKPNPTQVEPLQGLLAQFHGTVLDQTNGVYLLEFTGVQADLYRVLEQLKPYQILEFVRTGNVAMMKGSSTL